MPDDQTPTPPPVQPPPTTPAPPPPNREKDARTWNMLCHLSALAACVGIPFGNILGPLIVWQIKKNEFPSVDVHGKAALNFQITVTIAALICAFPMFFCLSVFAIPLALLIGLAGLVFAIIAGVKANNGEDYQYPWSLELVK